MAHQLALGELEDYYVTVEVEEQQPSMFDMLQGSGMEQMGMNMQDALSGLMPKKKKRRKMTVREARKVLTNEEASKLIDMDEVSQKLFREQKRAELSLSTRLIKLQKTAARHLLPMYLEKAFSATSSQSLRVLPLLLNMVR